MVFSLLPSVFMGTELVRIDNMFKSDFTALKESRRIQLQFAANRIKIGVLEIIICYIFLLWKYISKTHKTFQALSYHTDVVR